MLASTPEVCSRCGRGPIQGDPWEAGHITDAALGGGPEVRREHRSCNRRAGGKLQVELKRRNAEARAQDRIAATYRYLHGDRRG